MSLIVILGGPLLALAAHYFYYVPIQDAFLCYALVAWLFVATAWCFVLWRTRNTVVKLWNIGVIILVCIMIICIFTQKEGEEFPAWGISLLIKQGVIWALAMSYFAVMNFVKWRRGEI